MPNESVLLGGRPVRRMGFGAMQLPGPGVFGPPKDRDAALAVVRRVIDAGVNHIDTAQFYGPDVANELLREALYPYPGRLGDRVQGRSPTGRSGSVAGAQRPEQLRSGVEDNLASVGLEQVPVVNLRRHPESGVSFTEQLDAMDDLRQEGLIGAIGLSNVDLEEYRTARSRIDMACVQNPYNLADTSGEDVFEACRSDGVPFAPFFPLGSAFNPANPVLGAPSVMATAQRLDATPAQVALAWLLQRASNVLLIPGTSSLAHLEENLAAADVVLDEEALAVLP